MQLDTNLSNIAGIGPAYAKKLERLNLFTLKDLINHYPFRYDDFSNISSALEAKVGEKVTLLGEIWSINNVYTRSKKIITKAIFNDGTTPIELTWFHSSWLTKQIQTGERLQISGKVTKFGKKFSILMPQWEKIPDRYMFSDTVSENPLHTGRLVPVYPETYGISSKWIRTKIAKLLPNALDEISDPLPPKIQNNMVPLQQALKQIHFPDSYQNLEQARQRLGFDELFFIQLATLKARIDWGKKPLVQSFFVDHKKYLKFIKSLPFKLTSAQKVVLHEILNDLQKGVPMNRLIQGEVGSGKTVVAAATLYITYLNGSNRNFSVPALFHAFEFIKSIWCRSRNLYWIAKIYKG